MYAPTNHSHPDYVTNTALNTRLSGFAPTNHSHPNYYTQDTLKTQLLSNSIWCENGICRLPQNMILQIGKHQLRSTGNELFIEQQDLGSPSRALARFNGENVNTKKDRFLVFRNADGKSPMFYVNNQSSNNFGMFNG